MINATWHKQHPMPARATLDQRVRWHIAHAKACGCREIPATVLKELRRRGAAPPQRTRFSASPGARKRPQSRPR